jgi:ATPases involved in chromosome partitioning
MAQVYAVAGAKGGVGKTTTVANLGAVLASVGADVVVIDADLAAANLGTTLGVDIGTDAMTVHDVLAGDVPPEAAVYQSSAGVDVVPGSSDLEAYAKADPSELVRVIEAFSEVDYIFIDGAAGLGHDSAVPLSVADEVVVVSTPDRVALVDADRTRELTERLGGTVAGAVLTRVPPDGPTIDTDAHLDTAVRGLIPKETGFTETETPGGPLVTVAPLAPASVAYHELADELTAASVPHPAESESGDGIDGSFRDDGASETTDATAQSRSQTANEISSDGDSAIESGSESAKSPPPADSGVTSGDGSTSRGVNAELDETDISIPDAEHTDETQQEVADTASNTTYDGDSSSVDSAEQESGQQPVDANTNVGGDGDTDADAEADDTGDPDSGADTDNDSDSQTDQTDMDDSREQDRDDSESTGFFTRLLGR